MRVLFFKQKTAYEMRISDWSSDVCSSDLRCQPRRVLGAAATASAERGILHEEVMRREKLLLGAAARADIGAVRHQHPALRLVAQARRHHQIGRASCRERVCPYV